MRMHVLAVVVSLSVLWTACTTDGGSDRGVPILGEDVSELADVVREFDGADPLIHAARWEAVGPDSDLVRSQDLSVDDRCPPEAVTIEVTDDGLYLDVDTTSCSWTTVSQTSLMALSAGDTLRVWAFRWANVTADGQARFVVAAGDPPVTLWEVHPELPNDRSELYYEDVPVGYDLPAGTQLYWHVANHGQNVWSMIQLLRVHDDQ